MSRKDFQLIASVIEDAHDYASHNVVRQLAYEFATALATENPNFDHERFISACLES